MQNYRMAVEILKNLVPSFDEINDNILDLAGIHPDLDVEINFRPGKDIIHTTAEELVPFLFFNHTRKAFIQKLKMTSDEECLATLDTRFRILALKMTLELFFCDESLITGNIRRYLNTALYLKYL